MSLSLVPKAFQVVNFNEPLTYPLRFSCFKLLTTMKLSPILIRVNAARRFYPLDNFALPCKALSWPYTDLYGPQGNSLGLLYAFANKSLSSRKSTQQRASKFPNPPPLQRRWQISSISSLTLRLMQNFFTHNLSLKRHGVPFMLMWISYYPQGFQVFNHNSPLSSIPATFWKIW